MPNPMPHHVGRGGRLLCVCSGLRELHFILRMEGHLVCAAHKLLAAIRPTRTGLALCHQVSDQQCTPGLAQPEARH